MQYLEQSETQETYPEITGQKTSRQLRLETSAKCQAGSSSFRDAVEIIQLEVCVCITDQVTQLHEKPAIVSIS